MMLWREILLFSFGFLSSYVCLAPFAFPSVPTGAPSVPICLHLHAEQSKGEAEAETEGRSKRSPTIVSKLGSVEKVKVSDKRPPVLCSDSIRCRTQSWGIDSSSIPHINFRATAIKALGLFHSNLTN
ncbi:hypothetical protein Dimus_034123 [Dionaea muscipula]